MEKRNTLRIHACGGCGSNITRDIQSTIVKENVCDITYSFLDTSDDLVTKKLVGETIRIKSEQVKGDINGSGGTRGTNSYAIKETVEKYCNDLAKDEFAIDVVIFSGSGGSGSTIGNVLVADLMDRGHAVYVLLITDATNELYANNSLSTLATLSKISDKTGRNIVISEYRNISDRDKPYLLSMELNNKKLITHVECLALMFDEGHEDMDTKDIVHMFNTDDYKDLPTGLLFNTLHYGEVNGSFALARVLIDRDTFDVNTTMPESKHVGIGRVIGEHKVLLNEISPDGNIVMVLESNLINDKFTALLEEAKAMKANVLKSDAHLDEMDGFVDIDI